MAIWLIVLLFLAGCAGSPPLSSLKFAKDGAGDLETRQAAYECERDAQTVPPHPLVYSGGLTAVSAIKESETRQREFYIRCMEAKGFHRVP